MSADVPVCWYRLYAIGTASSAAKKIATPIRAARLGVTACSIMLSGTLQELRSAYETLASRVGACGKPDHPPACQGALYTISFRDREAVTQFLKTRNCNRRL